MRRPTEQLHRYNICGRPTLYRSVFSLKKDKAPETAVLGISCFRGSACSICTIIFPFSGKSTPGTWIFLPWRDSGPPGLPFSWQASNLPENRSLSHPPRCDSATMWFCNDVILQRSGVFIAAWSRNCSVPLSLHVFYNKEWNTSVSSGWTRDPCEWIPGPEKDGYL